MGQEAERRSRKAELLRLRENRKKLNEALKMLFDLLEEYAHFGTPKNIMIKRKPPCAAINNSAVVKWPRIAVSIFPAATMRFRAVL